MEKQERKVDYACIQQQALEQYRLGKSLTGKCGSFAPLFKQFLEAALEADLDIHINDENMLSAANRKNGKVSKILKRLMGRWNWLPAATAIAALNYSSLESGRPS